MGDERVSMPNLFAYYASRRPGVPRAKIERLPTDFPMRLRPNLLDEKPIDLLSRRLLAFLGGSITWLVAVTVCSWQI